MKTREEFEDLVDDVARAEWGLVASVQFCEGVPTAKRKLREAKAAVVEAWDEIITENEQDKINWRNDPLGEIEQVEAKNEVLQDKLDRIISWCNAIPLSVFPDPVGVYIRARLKKKA